VDPSDNSHTNWYADSLRHTNTATGLGEVTLIANYWLRKERAVQPIGNLAIGKGVKAPTGKNDVMGKWWNRRIDRIGSGGAPLGGASRGGD
jgi:hypothetical protein